MGESSGRERECSYVTLMETQRGLEIRVFRVCFSKGPDVAGEDDHLAFEP